MSAEMTARILVADDEESIRFVLREALGEEGCEVVDVDCGDAAFEALAAGDFQVAFLDIRMPGTTGLELLDRLQAVGSQTAVVIITAQNTFENAVEAMRRGAFDYLVKPFGIADVKAIAGKALRTHRLRDEVRALRREVSGRLTSGDRIVGKNAAMLEIFKTIGRVAGRDVSVLVTGESGTGKELVARAIHAASPRSSGAFVPVNTAAIPRDLLESELFGHERGAFTGALAPRVGRFSEASGGTLFLDEIGDMPADLQAKLLRVLQDQVVTPIGAKRAERVDVRIIAATHRDLDALVSAGSFREDLLYRLRVMPIHLPALRERSEDVAVLAEHFIACYAGDLAGGTRFLTDEAVAFLSGYSWPGNVRELENAIKRALVLSTGEVLTPEDFGFLASESSGSGDADSFRKIVEREVRNELENRETGEIYRAWLERVERPLLETVLSHTDGNQVRAAALLGINRNTLRKKIAELDLALPVRK
jgi:two-component system nitrogen regulation response regulator GlnG